MTNELLVEGLEYGLKIQKFVSESEHFLSCQEFDCDECKFKNSNSTKCLDICKCLLFENGDLVTEKNLKFLKEKYPEYLLKV